MDDQNFLAKKARLALEFAQLPNWETRYQLMIEKGKKLPPIPEERKSDTYRVKGCQSQVWLWVERQANGKLHIQADSDALIAKGIVALLVELYDQELPKTILENPPTFFKDWGVTVNLSMGRSNGLAAMIKQIQMYAIVFSKMEGAS
jgi:cysteine desulfuration protein SufE